MQRECGETRRGHVVAEVIEALFRGWGSGACDTREGLRNPEGQLREDIEEGWMLEGQGPEVGPERKTPGATCVFINMPQLSGSDGCY
jgi:hypothetical protein